MNNDGIELTASPAVVAFDVLEAAIDGYLAAVEGEGWRSSDAEMTALVERTHRVRGRMQYAHLASVAQFTERGIAVEAGGLNTRSWLRHRLRETVGASGVTAKLAVACTPKGQHAAVGAALASGALNWDQFRVTVKALDKLPPKTSTEHREFARDLLLQKAAELNADDLRKVGQALQDAADPDGKLKDDEEAGRVRSVQYRDHHDGTASITWRDRVDNIAAAKTAIGALDAPKPQPNGGTDPRTPAQRRADAMVHIFGSELRHGKLPTSCGRRPQIHITATAEALKGLDGAAKAALATGGAISLATLQRYLCDADITPIHLDPHGKPLSVGRTTRIWPPAIWAAIVARDTGCTFPGCDVPAHDCVAHHRKHWTRDHGETSEENGVLLCDRHHFDVHHHGWTVRLDRYGIPEFIPPPWVDSTGEPRTNDYWKLQQGLLVPITFPEPDPWE